jgi:23S rRNA (uracil1939-C5)-methyltransferase
VATETLELRIDRPVHGGRCVAYPALGGDGPGDAPVGDPAAGAGPGAGTAAAVERRGSGRVVLVSGGIPGEVVRAAVHVHKGVAFGETLEVLEASPDRRPAPAHPGLDLGHVALERQLAWKRQVLVDAARRAGLEMPTDAAAVVPSPAPWGYRGGIQPAIGGGAGGGPTNPRGDDTNPSPAAPTPLGYRRPGAHDVVVIDHDPTANEACAAAWSALQATPLPDGVVEAAIRGNDAGEALVALVARGDARDALDAAHALVRAGVAGVALAPYDARGRFRGGAQRLAGARSLTQRFGDVAITLTATAFAQPNPAAAGALFRLLAAWAPPARHALDLYAGNGVIAMHLAPRSERVTVIEIDRGAVERGRADAARAGFTHLMYLRLDAREVNVPDDVDLISVDPPRAGLAAATRTSIAASRARSLIYVSCDVATWARDVADLQGAGFRLQRLQPFDFQPHTHHLELLSLLER